MAHHSPRVLEWPGWSWEKSAKKFVDFHPHGSNFLAWIEPRGPRKSSANDRYDVSMTCTLTTSGRPHLLTAVCMDPPSPPWSVGGLGILPCHTSQARTRNKTDQASPNLFPPFLLLVMNSKRLWATAATIFALSAFSPHSSVVWAQVPMAVCSPGWEWVCFVLASSSKKQGRLCLRERSPVDCMPCRIRTRLGKIRVLFL